jgi:hypothetical protein
MIAEPPKDKAPPRSSLERRLKELGLFAAGSSRLVLLTWEDLQSDVALVSEVGDEAVAVGEQIDAAPVGLAAAILSPAEAERVSLVGRLRSAKRRDPLTLLRHDIGWDGKAFTVSLTRRTLESSATRVGL